MWFESTFTVYCVCERYTRARYLAVSAIEAIDRTEIQSWCSLLFDERVSIDNGDQNLAAVYRDRCNTWFVMLQSVFFIFFLRIAVRPLSVDILFNNQPLSADRNYELECQAIGSRPPSKITWWLGGIELTGHTQKVIWGTRDSHQCYPNLTHNRRSRTMENEVYSFSPYFFSALFWKIVVASDVGAECHEWLS